MSRRAGAVLWLVAGVVAGLAGTTGVARGRVHTVAVAERPVVALAAGGGRVAYRTRRRDSLGHVCDGVHVVGIDGRGGWSPLRCPSYIPTPGGPRYVDRIPTTGIGVSRGVLVYDSLAYLPEDATHDDAETILWRVGRDQTRKLEVDDYIVTCRGEAVGASAFAAGTGIVFTRTSAVEVDPAMECTLGSGGGDGVSSLTGATLRFVASRTAAPVDVAGAPGAARIAVQAGIAAIVPLRLPQAMGHRIVPPAAAQAQVQSWSLTAGTRNCTATLTGAPSAVATNGHQIAVLVPGAVHTHLVRLSARTCTVLGDRTLTHARPGLALANRFVVWAAGRSVLAMGLRTGRVQRLHTGSLPAQGVTVSGGQVFWWIRGATRSRILRTGLP